jgi:hypothetical protein
MLQFDGLVCLSALPVLKTKKDALQKIIHVTLQTYFFQFCQCTFCSTNHHVNFLTTCYNMSIEKKCLLL